ncbi:TPA: transposase [Salmonella enterica subsp. enterica serovar 16:l,v:-]|nr:transposase [Salmonella enterica subsp. enterica serovar 16:l,v:-]
MDENKLKALAAELAKGFKTEADLNQFSRMLTKLTVETALNAELIDHLGHEKNAPKKDSNTRNGYSSKTLLSDDGEIELNTPRDRENTFEPLLIKKHQTRITQMDSQILSLYAKGMTTREIVATFKEMIRSQRRGTVSISKNWRAHRENLNTFFGYPPDSRKAIYTTNAIESLNSVIRAAIKKRKVFPTDDSVRKVIYLTIKDASKKWSMPLQSWRLAMSRFIIEFGDRRSAEESPVMGG